MYTLHAGVLDGWKALQLGIGSHGQVVYYAGSNPVQSPVQNGSALF